MEKKFPLYLKSFNEKNFYCILNAKKMIEVQIIGKKSFIFNIEALKYPEMQRISELITNASGELILITEDEFNQKLNNSKTN